MTLVRLYLLKYIRALSAGIPTTDKFDHGIPVAHFQEQKHIFFGKIAPLRSLVENDDEIKYVLLSSFKQKGAGGGERAE